MRHQDMRDKAIGEINATIEVGEAILRGDIDLAQLNAPIPEDERWASAEDAARPSFERTDHYIQFAINLGLLDRKQDAKLLQEWGRRIGLIKAEQGGDTVG